VGLFKKKKKKEPKIEQVFESKTEEPMDIPESTGDDIKDFLGIEEYPEDDNLTETQRKKKQKLDSVKSKISKILQSQNIEIVDENFGDEYEKDTLETSEQSEQDYDALKSIFGDSKKDKKQELTLTIDDFDYTYIGQYLEEYDLTRMKNIKRVKLIRKKNPKLKKFLIAASVVLVLAGGGVLTFFLTREKPVYLKSVTLNQTERSYYLNEIFDYTGLYFIAEYSDGRKETIELSNSHLNEHMTTKVDKAGEDKQDLKFGTLGTANLYFTYNGFNVEYIVNVVKKEEKGFSLLYTDAIFNLNKDDYITADMIQLIVDYASYGKEFITLSAINDSYTISVDGHICTFDKDNGFLITGDVTSTSRFIIKTKNLIKQENGEGAIMSIELDRNLNFMNAQKES